ncbi:MAG: prolipoprotein diacylglyceryl transferase [Bacteroidales bacterium]|nr:prolipoprotein diacylglyceryl transferase [Bacteroidales bacterium]
MISQLFVNWNMNPILFHIGGFAPRWYSLLFAAGFVLGWFIMKSFYKREGVPVKLMDPLLYTLIIATIIGSRLGHCLFYQPDYYFGSWKGFLEIFMVWKGGLASHGGTIAVTLSMWWYAHHYGKKYGFDFVWMVDHVCIPICFAGMFIRLGNLCNSEIYGNVTNLPWGFIFLRNHETLPKHPTQIYEALCYCILGIVLMWLYWHKIEKFKRGQIFGIFFIVLFGTRFLIEFIKEPQVGFEENMVLNMGQLLSIPFILIGVGFLIYAHITKLPAALTPPASSTPKPPREVTIHAHSIPRSK